MSGFFCIVNVRFLKSLLEGLATAQYIKGSTRRSRLHRKHSFHKILIFIFTTQYLFSDNSVQRPMYFSSVIDKRTTYVWQGNIKLKQIDLPVFNTLLTNSNESYLWLHYLLSYTRITVILSNKLGVTLQRCPYGRQIYKPTVGFLWAYKMNSIVNRLF